MTNAQITLFIIIGIALLASAGLVIFVGSKQQVQQAQKKIATPVVVRPVIEYVTSCLEIVAKDALKTIGLQGGVIYQEQGGITPEQLPQALGKDYVVFDDKKIAYAIYPPTEDMGTLFYHKPPDYPWDVFPFAAPDTDDTLTIGFFGTNKLPPLYNTSPNSVQQQLETAIGRNTPKCTDWTQFETQGLVLSPGEPAASMLIASNLTQLATEEAISFTLYWPIEVKDKSGSTAVIDSFKTTIPLPFGKIYYAARGLIDKEVQDINFTINSSTFYNLFVKQDVAGKDDLVTLQFFEKLGEQPYVFQFARHNRAPALVFIRPGRIEDFVWHAGVKFATAGSELIIDDPCPDTGMPDRLALETLDPDEDTASYVTQPEMPAEFREPSGTNPPFELRIAASDGEITDYQTLRVRTTCCPAGCPQ